MSKVSKFNDTLALWITAKVATVWCSYLFAVIGVTSLVGIFTNNVTLALIAGSISSYFLQLVLLPLIMVGQKLQSEKHDELNQSVKNLHNKHDAIHRYLTNGSVFNNVDTMPNDEKKTKTGQQKKI